MIFEEALARALKNYSPLNVYIDSRVYPIQIPQEKPLPALAWQRVSTMPTETMDCPDSSLLHARIQIDVIAKTHLDAREIAQQVRAAMQDTTEFQAVKVTDRDLPGLNPDIHRVLLEFNIWYQE